MAEQNDAVASIYDQYWNWSGYSGNPTDFIGFSFNGVHSSELNIKRVSSNNRYNDSVIPNFNDTTAQVAGHDGTLYWDSFYSNRTFQISIAFDNMSEVQYRRFRQVFNGKAYGYLIFDEMPYKQYSVKVQTPPQLNTLCFDEGNQRVYKGEGTIQFVAFYPFAKEVYKYKDLYKSSEYPAKNEWINSTGFGDLYHTFTGSAFSSNVTYYTKDSEENFNATTDTEPQTGTTYYYKRYDVNYMETNLEDHPTSQAILVRNEGDMPTDWVAYYPMIDGACPLIRIRLWRRSRYAEDGVLGDLRFKSTMSKINENDAYIRVNSATNLVEGCDSNRKPTGSLYNKYISAGDFFKIPVSVGSNRDYIFYSTGSSSIPECEEVVYDYLFY